MPEFLNLLPPDQAREKWFSAIPGFQPGIETVGLSDSFGRILAEDIFAAQPLPAFPRATVDGYAVRAADTFGASDVVPAYFRLVGEIPMGVPANLKLEIGEAAAIHTGGMLPEGADGVVMLEFTQRVSEDEIEVTRAIAPNENVLLTGEDVQPGDKILEAGTNLGAAEMGGLAALGFTRVKVCRKLRVGIISSGDEIIPADANPLPGQVRDVNTYSLSGLIKRWNAEPISYGIVKDQPEDLKERLLLSLSECDLVIITAGSSASTRDHTAAVIDQMGSPGVLVHGVNVRPGKPTILAVCGKKPVVGLPGNPVSALVIARLFIHPLLERLSGEKANCRLPVGKARLTVNLISQAGREDWTPVKIIKGSDGFHADPVFYKSNLIFSLVQADGLVRIAPEVTGLEPGTEVEVWPIEG